MLICLNVLYKKFYAVNELDYDYMYLGSFHLSLRMKSTDNRKSVAAISVKARNSKLMNTGHGMPLLPSVGAT